MSPNTVFVLQSADATSEPWHVTLAELYPHPPLYMGLPVVEQQRLGQEMQPQISSQIPLLANTKTTTTSNTFWKDLWEKAQQATQEDTRDDVHAIRYGAAAALMDTTSNQVSYITASQCKALEYGATLDAVCQLVPPLVQQQQQQRMIILGLVQVDQYGLPHAPFAPARSLLVEHGLGDTPVLTSRRQDAMMLQLHVVTARDLAPFAPEFRS
uniref:Uncharacterized protein n=1 Tax=Entomoneis paludosa TaxID=265537 RepID=A0A7S2YQI8_9STRA